MKYRKNFIKSEKGNTVLIAMVVLTIMLLSGIAFSKLIINEIGEQRYDIEALQARNLAENAIETSIFAIRQRIAQFDPTTGSPLDPVTVLLPHETETPVTDLGIDASLFAPLPEGSLESTYVRLSVSPSATTDFNYPEPVTIQVRIKGTGTTISGRQRSLESGLSFTFVPSLLPSGSPVYVSTSKWESK